MKYCTKCGYEMQDADRFCNNCGADMQLKRPEQPVAAPAAEKRPEQPVAAPTADMVTPDQLKVQPILAAVLSFFLAGLGQIINGQVVKGVVILAGVMIGGTLLTLLTFGLFMLLYPVLWFGSAFDAYLCAKKMEEGKAIGKWSFFGK